MKEPLPEEFGITNQQIDRFKSRREDWERRTESIYPRFVLVVLLLFSSYVFWQTKSIGLALLYGFGAVIPVLLAGMILIIAVPSGLLSLVEKRSPVYKRTKDYEAAAESYHSWLKKTEKEWLRTQEQYWWSLPGHGFEQELASLYTRLG